MVKWGNPTLTRHWLQKAHDAAMTNAFESHPANPVQWRIMRVIGQFPMELILVHIPMFDKCRELE